MARCIYDPTRSYLTTQRTTPALATDLPFYGDVVARLWCCVIDTKMLTVHSANASNIATVSESHSHLLVHPLESHAFSCHSS